jgi:hypothetical protein
MHNMIEPNLALGPCALVPPSRFHDTAEITRDNELNRLTRLDDWTHKQVHLFRFGIVSPAGARARQAIVDDCMHGWTGDIQTIFRVQVNLSSILSIHQHEAARSDG